MAGTITLSSQCSIVNGNFTDDINFGPLEIVQTAIGGGNPGIVDIGTSEEDIALGDIATPRWTFFKNLDTTNYFEVGPKSGGAMVVFARLGPGEGTWIPLAAGVTLRAKANTATVRALIKAHEA